jgi:hypothetical protein
LHVVIFIKYQATTLGISNSALTFEWTNWYLYLNGTVECYPKKRTWQLASTAGKEKPAGKKSSGELGLD